MLSETSWGVPEEEERNEICQIRRQRYVASAVAGPFNSMIQEYHLAGCSRLISNPQSSAAENARRSPWEPRVTNASPKGRLRSRPGSMPQVDTSDPDSSGTPAAEALEGLRYTFKPSNSRLDISTLNSSPAWVSLTLAIR